MASKAAMQAAMDIFTNKGSSHKLSVAEIADTIDREMGCTVDRRVEYKKAALHALLVSFKDDFGLPSGAKELASQAGEFADAMIAEDEQHA